MVEAAACELAGFNIEFGPLEEGAERILAAAFHAAGYITGS